MRDHNLLDVFASEFTNGYPLNYGVNFTYMALGLFASFIIAMSSKKFRSIIIVLLSIVIVYGLTQSTNVLIYYALLTFLCLVLFSFCKRYQNRLTLVTAISFFVLNLVGIKYFSPLLASWSDIFDDSLPLLGMLGISYATFKILDLLLEANRGRIKEGVSSLDVAALIWFFPTFAQGPIQRSIPFTSQLQQDCVNLFSRVCFKDAERLCWGVVKIGLLSKLMWVISPLNTIIQPRILQGELSIIELWVSLYALYLYIYLEFSGISDIAITLSRWAGFDVPENFNFPILARNPQEFWNRWHMSLTRWCQDHIFFNLYKYNVRRFRGRGEWLLILAPIYITFILIGVWHGNSWAWFYYGLTHATAVYLVMLLKKPTSKFFATIYNQSKLLSSLMNNLGRFLTLSFVSLTLICALPDEVMQSYLAQVLGV